MTRAAGKGICHPSPIGQVRLLFPEGLRRLLPQPLCRPEVQGPAVGVRAQLCSGQRVLECPPAPCMFAQAPPHSRFSLCLPGERAREVQVWFGLVGDGEENWKHTAPSPVLPLRKQRRLPASVTMDALL